jgi:hypothetical protein
MRQAVLAHTRLFLPLLGRLRLPFFVNNLQTLESAVGTCFISRYLGKSQRCVTGIAVTSCFVICEYADRSLNNTVVGFRFL